MTISGIVAVGEEQMMDHTMVRRPGPVLGRCVWRGAVVVAVASASLVAGTHAASAAAALASNCAGDLAVVSCTFGYNGTTGDDGTSQQFTVPRGVNELTIEAWGAQGGDASTTDAVFSTPAVGGLGGYTRATVTVTAGQVVQITVGGQPTGTSGGFNGGGTAGPGTSDYQAAAGGGATDARLGGGDLSDRVVVAGGGGGGAWDDGLDYGDAFGGAGGGATGTASGWCPQDGFIDTCGAGATATTGGAAGSPASGCATDGTLGQGGSGCGGGGGGGYYGGGGGGFVEETGPTSPAIEGPGGGGSGYVSGSATGTTSAGGVQYGNGMLRISYATSHTYPGLTWSPARHIDGAPGGLTAVSCPDTTYCVAVDGEGNAVTYDAGRWSKPVNVATGELSGVSCPSRTFCVAVGSVYPSTTSEPVIAVDRHGTWSSTTGPVAGLQEYLTAVSCVSADFCVAAGTFWPDGAPGTTAFVQTFDGHTWTTEINYDLTGYASGDSMAAVSCRSTSFCVAAGIAGDRGDIGGLVDVDSKGSWTGTQISDDRLQGFDSSGGLGAIACPAANSCLAAGPDGYIYSYDGQGWTVTDGDRVAAVTALSCPDATTCLAADGAGDVSTNQAGLWEVPQPADPKHAVTSLSCPTTRFCVGVDKAGDAVVAAAP
jgi:Glycine rich protein